MLNSTQYIQLYNIFLSTFVLELELTEEEEEWDEQEDECEDDEEYVVAVDEPPGPAGGGALGCTGIAGADGGKLGGGPFTKTYNPK